MQAREPLAGDELERQLARYARVRLDPTPAQSRRARAAAMEAAWRRRLEPAVDRTGASRRGPFAGWPVRRLGASLAAAVLAGLLVGSATFAASRAGGPLYEARVTLESMTLPTDPDARVEAELAMAQTRLAEIVDASGRGDEGALSAALAAYGQSLDDLGATSGAPADRALEAIQFHRAVLLRLVGTAPEAALGGLRNALDHSTGVIDRLDAAGGTGVPSGNGAGAGGNGNAGGNGGTSGNGNAGGNGGGPATSPDPAKGPDPSRGPDPSKTPTPDKSTKPAPGAPSPAPSPSDQPGKP